MKSLRVIRSTLILQMKNSWVRPMFRLCLLITPFAQTILMYEMFKNSGQENFGAYVILGSGLMGLWSCICFSSAGDINRERWNGTLSMIFTAPAGFQLIIFSKILGNTLLSLVTLLISFLTAKVIYNADISMSQPLYMLFAIFWVVICFIVFSMLIAYLLTLSRKTLLYTNIIEIPIVFLCGFIIPVEFLPTWAQIISYILPPTWAIKLLRLSMEPINFLFWQVFGVLVLTTTSYLIITLLVYKHIDKQIRKSATLEVF